MSLEMKVLEFILKNEPVSDELVERKFGDAGVAALNRLVVSKLAGHKYGPPDAIGQAFPLPGSLRVTKPGKLELKNFKSAERRVRKDIFWTRILAIIAILISLGSLAISFLSLRQGK